RKVPTSPARSSLDRSATARETGDQPEHAPTDAEVFRRRGRVHVACVRFARERSRTQQSHPRGLLGSGYDEANPGVVTRVTVSAYSHGSPPMRWITHPR